MIVSEVTLNMTGSARAKYLESITIIIISVILTHVNLTEIVFLGVNTIDSSEIVSPNLNYTIQNEGCTIPRIDVSHDALNDFNQNRNDMPCKQIPRPLLQKNKTHIWVLDENLHYYRVNNSIPFKCCYTPLRYFPYKTVFSSKTQTKDRDPNDCIYFQKYIEAKDEFVRVTCSLGVIVNYEQSYVFAVKKPFTRQRSQPFDILQNSSYNVIILGLSSVSRIRFQRQMKYTSNFMMNKEAIELWGYNRVGDNTFQNMIPVLVGMNNTEINKICRPSAWAPLDHCPCIWERYKDSGYYTAFVEDTPKFGIFKSEHLGLKTTDYYLRPIASESKLNNEKNRISSCVDYHNYRIALNYVQNLISVVAPSKLFALFWESAVLGNRNVNHSFSIDIDYEAFINNLDKSGYLNDSILIVLSDGGFKHDYNSGADVKQIIEKLPVASVLVPPSFRHKYPLAYKNLQTNSRRLTTPYDMHETLIDLIDLNALSNEEIRFRSSLHYMNNRGISLFLPLPTNRTCISAGISDKWCACLKYNSTI